MRPKSLFLIVIALGCGLVASIGVSQVLERRNQEGPTGAAETEQVYVAMVDINTGDPLTADLVKLEDWPKGRLPHGAISNLDDLLGRRPRTPLVAGEVILSGKLIDGDSPYGAAERIPEGMRVSSVKVAVGDTPTGLVLPGDRVDVLCYFRASNEIPEATTKTILRNVTVFAVNEQTVREADLDQTVINAKTVALLLTPGQDRILMLAAELGKLRISLRRAGDEIEDGSDTVTLSDLLDQGAQDATYTAHHDEPEQSTGGIGDFIDQQEALPLPATFRMQIMTPDDISTFEWDDEGLLPTAISTPAASTPLSAAPMVGDSDMVTDPDSDLEPGLDFDPQDFDPTQIDEMIDQTEQESE